MNMDKLPGDSLPAHGPIKVGSSAWGIPHTANVLHDSSDVSLFSSSLPVLPHGKCKLEMMLLIEHIRISKY